LPFDFRLPDVGEGIEAAQIVDWKVRPGDRVDQDGPLVEIETDKAIVAIPSPTSGVVLRLGAEAGETLRVGDVLVVLDGADGGVAHEDRSQTDEIDGLAAGAAKAAGRPLASPAVRKLALERGIDLTQVEGGGPHGRIRRTDLEGVPAPASPGPDVAPARADAVEPLRGIRRSIARTLTHSWQTIPHVIDYREADATALDALRRTLRDSAGEAGDAQLAGALTITPLLVRMAATLLPRHRSLNAAVDMEREQVTFHGSIDIGVATATSEGLLVPVVRDADGKSLRAIALELAELAPAARAGKLTRAQLTGATFTVNNFGALGAWLGTPIIGPGQTANLGVGRMERRAVVRGDEVVVRPVLTLACAADHRLIDGDTLASFVTDFVRLVEEPALLLQELR
jgi:pyruvate/2-oxoglutarate dehydrogenase complex dihydrolipoamide acyltransferase (E2) component